MPQNRVDYTHYKIVNQLLNTHNRNIYSKKYYIINNMQNTSLESASTIIANELKDTIANSIVLLVSGGSSAQLALKVLNLLSTNIINKTQILLADERYVPYDSPSSNGRLLKLLGINKLTNNFHELLEPTSKSLEYYINKYNMLLKDYVENSDYVVSILGLGVDGHTAGILPNCNMTFKDDDFVAGYLTEPFGRVTIAPSFFNKINMAYVYAQGPQKQTIVDRFYDGLSGLPMDNIKNAKKYIILYNEEEK